MIAGRFPGPKAPDLPDFKDEAACERWIQQCYPRDGETYAEGMYRMANGMMVLMRELMRRMLVEPLGEPLGERDT